jgi:CelD/BcsL family acetyltransferase involved in cellulose biosynthesis
MTERNIKENIHSEKAKKKTDLGVELNGNVVRGFENIAGLAKDWDDLFARATGTSAYLSRAWAETFIAEKRIRGVPLVITVYCGSKLVALFALSVKSLLGLRIAECIGTREPSYLGILVDPKFPEAIKTVVDVLAREKVAHIFYNKYLSSLDEATNKLVAELDCHGFVCKFGFRRYSNWIRLGGSFEDYLINNKSGKSRQTIRRKERKLRKNEQVKLEYYAGIEVNQKVVSRIATIQEESWMRGKGAVKLSQPFQQRLLLNMAKAGLGRVWLLRINDDDAAFVYAYVAHKKLNYIWTAFKLKYTKYGSIGMVLTSWTIRKACEDSILSYDFGFGATDYKEFWSTDCLDIHRVVAGRGVWGCLAVYCYCITWWIAKNKWVFSFYLKLRKRVNLIRQELNYFQTRHVVKSD